MIEGSIKIEEREDGGIRVSSIDWPGLLLSGTDHEKVMSCVLPAIKALEAHRPPEMCVHKVPLLNRCAACEAKEYSAPMALPKGFGTIR